MPRKPLARPLFRHRGFVVGVIHLQPLPGTPRAALRLEEVYRNAEREAEIYLECGMDGLILENHGDAPFTRDDVEPHIPAALAVLADRLRRTTTRPIGINILRNAGAAALGAATAGHADFVRVNVLTGVAATDQGLIQGCAADLLRYRRQLEVQTAIFADINVKYSRQIYQPDLDLLARSTIERGGADALIVTGHATGQAVDFEELTRVRAAVPEALLLAGSGVTPLNILSILKIADGVIVGSCLKRDGRVENPVEKRRVVALMSKVRRR